MEALLSTFCFQFHWSEQFGAVLCGNTREILCEIRVFTIIYHADTRSFSPRLLQWLLKCPVTQAGARGRPTITISQAQIEVLVEIGFNYRTIARMFGVSERTLLHRSEYDLPVGCSFTDVTDIDLDTAVRSILNVSQLVMRTGKPIQLIVYPEQG